MAFSSSFTKYANYANLRNTIAEPKGFVKSYVYIIPGMRTLSRPSPGIFRSPSRVA